MSDQSLNPDSAAPVPTITRVDVQPQERFEEVASRCRATERQVRVRCELRLYNPDTDRYQFWPDTNWTMDVVPDVQVGMQVRTCFYEFVKALTTIGPDEVLKRLKP